MYEFGWSYIPTLWHEFCIDYFDKQGIKGKSAEKCILFLFLKTYYRDKIEE